MSLPPEAAVQGDPASVARRHGGPALQAAGIQVLSFVLVLLLAWTSEALFDLTLARGVVSVMQGVLAAAISRWRSLAPWWQPIQFVFPVAATAVHALHLPAWIFLSCFLFLLALYWSTFRTQVPYYPSTRAVREALVTLLPANAPLRFIDIGSGFGGMVIALARQNPNGVFSGIELAPLPWLASYLRARICGSSANFMRGDYGQLDFSCFDVVFAYLSPAAMPELWQKVHTEMAGGGLFLSYEFPVPGVEPQLCIQPAKGGPNLYGWRF